MGKNRKGLSKKLAIASDCKTFDSTMAAMEEIRFRKRHQKLILSSLSTLRFNYQELICMFLIYYKLQKQSKDPTLGCDKKQFQEVLHCTLDITDDHLIDRIFYAIDKTSSSVMSMETWIHCLNLFLKGTIEEKIDYCFTVYDTSNEKKIGMGAMFHLLKNSLIGLGSEEDVEETAKDMTEMLTKKMDLDRDGHISYKDFKQTVLKHPMLLETFGQCLPSRSAVNSLLTTFSNNPVKF